MLFLLASSTPAAVGLQVIGIEKAHCKLGWAKHIAEHSKNKAVAKYHFLLVSGGHDYFWDAGGNYPGTRR